MIDLENMKSLADGKPIFDDLDNTVDSSIFKRTWRINSTVAKAAICLLAQFKPRSFLTGMTVDLSNSLAAYNAREFHHIYPKAFLSDAGIGFHEANVIANICLLTSNDNNLIKDRNPAEYFRDIQSDQKDQIMNAALIPLSVSDGSKPFAEFIRLRAETLSKYASELIRTG